MEEKIKIIKQIVKKDPRFGIKNGLGWFYSNIFKRERSGWNFEKILDTDTLELQNFLNRIIEEEKLYK